jgi:hypothetical protein
MADGALALAQHVHETEDGRDHEDQAGGEQHLLERAGIGVADPADDERVLARGDP